MLSLQPKNWDWCSIGWTCWGFKPGMHDFSRWLWESVLQEVRGRSQGIWEFQPKTQGIELPKYYCWLKKTRHPELMNLEPFCVREEAMALPQNHSFDVHLRYLGPNPAFFHVYPLWVHSWSNCSSWWFHGCNVLCLIWWGYFCPLFPFQLCLEFLYPNLFDFSTSDLM